jgi:hypothetical protein
MELSEVYSVITKVCNDNYIADPYLVGGVPRDFYLKSRNFNAPADYDITTNDSDIMRLAITASEKLGRRFRFFPDGHMSIYMEDLTFDFSSNFVSPKAVEYIDKELGISDENMFEVYSRDFTINTLHKSFLSDNVLDFTGRAKEDLDKKVISTVLPPDISLQDDFRRVFRSINFAARLGFSIDSIIMDYVLNNRHEFTGKNKSAIKDAFITSIIAKSIDSNADITMHYLGEMGLLSAVPLVGVFKDEVIKRKLVNKYLDDAISTAESDLKSIEF